jgi:cell wall-associated NlpC family hydrolase
VAHPQSRRFRSLAAAAVLAAAALAVPPSASAQPNAAPPPPRPTINSVHHRLASLTKRNDQLVERYNRAQLTYRRRQAAARRARRRADIARRRLRGAKAQLSAAAAAEYEGGMFSSTGALLSSDSGSNYLTELGTLDMLSAHNAQLATSYTAAKHAADARRLRARHLLDRAGAKRAAVADEKHAVRKQIRKYKRVLARLDARQRARWRRQFTSAVPPTEVVQIRRGLEAVDARRMAHPHRGSQPGAAANPGTGALPVAARTAVRFALAQVGKPYAFGAAGPSAYDCSGLTMASWHAAGVNLPHSALEQYSYGRHINFDELRPGDLLFFYQPIGHVTIYIGHGLMVSAPEPGEDVKVVRAKEFGSDYTGATRLVG